MTVSTAHKLVTGEELLAMGTDFHGELVQGRLVEMAPASWKHGQYGVRASSLIDRFVGEQRLGVVVAAETGFYLQRNPDTVRAPDVGFIAAARAAVADEKGFFNGPPDLAIEVLSPNDKVFEVEQKIDDYLRAGCRLVWVINPKFKTITAHQPGQQPRVYREGQSLDGSDVLPGFSCPVSDFMV